MLRARSSPLARRERELERELRQIRTQMERLSKGHGRRDEKPVARDRASRERDERFVNYFASSAFRMPPTEGRVVRNQRLFVLIVLGLVGLVVSAWLFSR